MKILVCVSKVPDTTAKIAFTESNTKFDSNNVQFIMNPTDEWYALVRAVELKEKNGGTVTVINVGGSENDQIIRKSLAIGADNAVRVNLSDDAEAFNIASQIAHHAKEEHYDIVFTGKETIDGNGFTIGGMLAELLDQAYVTLATKMEYTDGTATINREIEGGEEVVEVKTPFVVSASKGMAEQRIPNMRGIMQARSKPLTVVEPISVEARAKVVQYELPEAKSECKLVDADNVEELVRLLAEEAKVI